jgi:hypothetical protein
MESHIKCPKCLQLIDVASYDNHELLLCTSIVNPQQVESQQIDDSPHFPADVEPLSPSLQSLEYFPSSIYSAEEVEIVNRTSFRYDRTPEEYKKLFLEKLSQIRVGNDKVMDKRFEEAKNDIGARLIQRYLL